MSRRVISYEAIAGLIRAQMTLVADCQGCSCGPVKWRQPDGDGCNWILSRLEGSQGLVCLERLVPLLNSLRCGFNVPEPHAHLDRVAPVQPRRHAHPVARTEAERLSAQTEGLLGQARAAVRDSRSFLRHHHRTLPMTSTQCRRAEQAIAASLALLGREPAGVPFDRAG